VNGLREHAVITFDCYGTLVDWESGIGDAFVAAAESAGVVVDATEALRLYMEIEPRVQAEAFLSYRRVLTETAGRVLGRLGVVANAEASGFLAASLPEWPVFDDTRTGLLRLSEAGYRLGILSNVDDDLLEASRRRIDVPFDPDLVVTAEQVGSYKPAHGHFHEARRRIGGAPWLHAAQSWFHDVAPAVELGIPVAWVNRNHEEPRGWKRPDLEVVSIGRLADALS
jgi:2-haloalkanoic acid dehalogenase type II